VETGPAANETVGCSAGSIAPATWGTPKPKVVQAVVMGAAVFGGRNVTLPTFSTSCPGRPLPAATAASCGVPLTNSSNELPEAVPDAMSTSSACLPVPVCISTTMGLGWATGLASLPVSSSSGPLLALVVLAPGTAPGW
jgi:hypothetical protein